MESEEAGMLTPAVRGAGHSRGDNSYDILWDVAGMPSTYCFLCSLTPVHYVFSADTRNDLYSSDT